MPEMVHQKMAKQVPPSERLTQLRSVSRLEVVARYVANSVTRRLTFARSGHESTAQIHLADNQPNRQVPSVSTQTGSTHLNHEWNRRTGDH